MGKGFNYDPTLKHAPRYPEQPEGHKAGSKVPRAKKKAKRRKAKKQVKGK